MYEQDSVIEKMNRDAAAIATLQIICVVTSSVLVGVYLVKTFL